MDLWIGTGGRAIAQLVLPVLKPKAFLPVHFDGLYASFWDGLKQPYKDDATEQVLSAANVKLVRPMQYMDKWRLDRGGVTPLENARVKQALGLK